MKKKETQKISDQVKQSCERLGQFRQLLAFGFSAPVFDSKGNVLNETHGIELFAAKEDYVHPLHPEFSEKELKVFFNHQIFFFHVDLLLTSPFLTL